MSDGESAYNVGQAAFRAGSRLGANPHRRSGVDWCNWRGGWLDARDVARFFKAVVVIDSQKVGQ